MHFLSLSAEKLLKFYIEFIEVKFKYNIFDKIY